MFNRASLVFQSLVLDSLRQDTGLGDSGLGLGVADKPGSLGEEFLHLLQRHPFCLGEHGPEEDGIGEIADLKGNQLPAKFFQSMCLYTLRGERVLKRSVTHHEQDVEFPSGVCHSNGCHLTDHCTVWHILIFYPHRKLL